MSITFWAPDAPTRLVTPYPEDEPDYVERQSLLPEINLSNSNAAAMMEALGIPFDHCGRLEVAQLDAVIAQAARLANVPEERLPFLLNPVEEGGTLHKGEVEGNVVALQSRARFYAGGRSDDYLVRTALRFLTLFVEARQGNFTVSWG